MPVYIKDDGQQRDLFADLPRGKVLDFPTGEGKEYLHLTNLGFQVVPGDMFTERFKRIGQPCIQADGNGNFPFKEGSFDYVLCRESIEHLENQSGYIRECARVLKPGGKLVITTPNVLHLIARLSYFLTGQRLLRGGLINEVQSLRSRQNGAFFHGHAFLIDYFRLRYVLRLSGFGSIKIFTDRYSPSSIALSWVAPILFVAAKVSIKMSIRRRRRKTGPVPDKALFQELLGHVFSPALLFGKRMIVVAERRSEVEVEAA